MSFTRTVLRSATAAVLTLTFTLTFTCSQAQTDPKKAFEASYKAEKNKDLPGAIKAIKGAYDANSYEQNLRLGWLYYSSASHTESMTHYQKAIALMPAAVEPRFGYIYPAAAVGNWEAVRQQYEEILKLDPKNSYANYRIGMIYYSREEYKKAFDYFQVGANLYPFDYDYTLMLAWSNYRLGRVREAKVLFNKVLIINPGDASANEGLGLLN